MRLTRFYGDRRVRAEIKRAITRGQKNINRQVGVDWKALWDCLEFAAHTYVRSIEDFGSDPSSLSPRATIKSLTAARDKIDNVIATRLDNPQFFNWDFISFRGGRTIMSESPKAHRHIAAIIEGLTKVRDDFSDRIKFLQQFTGNQKTRKYTADDCESIFLGIVLQIGRDVIGTNRVGSDEGPLITFMEAAARPLLKGATPPAETLRTFARRH